MASDNLDRAFEEERQPPIPDWEAEIVEHTEGFAQQLQGNPLSKTSLVLLVRRLHPSQTARMPAFEGIITLTNDADAILHRREH